MEEVWKDVKGYEGLYQVSSLGRVRNVTTTRILKQAKHHGGYMLVRLSKNGKAHTCTVHRLAAQSFISNPENKPQVNHIDENKTNNNVSNLEWVTSKENINHGTRTERQIYTQRIIQKSRPVICSNGVIYRSTREASRLLGLDNSSLNKVLKGKRKTVGGFTFKYKEW